MQIPPPFPLHRRFLWKIPAGLLLLCALGSTANAADKAAAGKNTQLTYIIWCDCSSSREQGAIAEAVRRYGGEVVYVYPHLSGLAVNSPPNMSRRNFVNKIRRLPRVIEVVKSENLEMDKIQ